MFTANSPYLIVRLIKYTVMGAGSAGLTGALGWLILYLLSYVNITLEHIFWLVVIALLCGTGKLLNELFN